MGLRDRISALFGRNQAAATTSTRTVTEAGQISAVAEKFMAEQERMAIIKSCRKMYDTDPRVRKALRTYARDLVRSGYFVKTEDTRAAEVAAAMQKRLGLNQLLQDAVRLSGRDGDSFYEVVVDENMLISKFTRKPTLLMHRNSNSQDEFDQASRAYWLGGPFYASPEPPADAVWFSEWQVIHARWEHDEEKRYGTPMMAAATGAFKKVSEGETDLAVRRKTRAGMRYLHVVEGAGADVEAYKEINQVALNNPFAALADFFTNKPGSISVIQGDAHLNEINDVLHHISTMFTASDVPMELIAYGEGLNRDILGEKKAEYAETQEDGREWITEQIVKPLLERQWLLQGIFPASVNYEIIWRKAKSLSPTDLRDLADAMMRLRVLGVKEDIIQSLLAQFLPGVDLEILAGEGMDSERFADMLKGLSI